MHELSIVFEVVDSLEKLAKENNIHKIVGLTMEIGEVSTVIPDYFRDCFEWAKEKHELIKDCKLDIVVLEAISYCRDCKETFSTTKYGKECPHCHKDNTYLITGDELNIRDIKVIDE